MGEVGDIVVAHLHGHLVDGGVGMGEEFFCLAHTNLLEVAADGNARLFLENPGEIVGVQVEHFGQDGPGYILAIMLADIVLHLAHHRAGFPDVLHIFPGGLYHVA